MTRGRLASRRTAAAAGRTASPGPSACLCLCKAQLATRRAELERRYAQRLEWMGEALVAIAEGEGAEAFRARLFES